MHDPRPAYLLYADYSFRFDLALRLGKHFKHREPSGFPMLRSLWKKTEPAVDIIALHSDNEYRQV
jgi:hypothetical protein